MRQKPLIIAACVLGLLPLGACGYDIEFFPDTGTEPKRHRVVVPQPELTNPPALDNAPSPSDETSEGQADMEAKSDAAFMSLNTQSINTQDALPENSFVASLSPEERLQNLEKSVVEMRNTLNALAPAILKLASYSLEEMTERPSNGAPVQLSPQLSRQDQNKYIGAPINALAKAAKDQYRPKVPASVYKPAPKSSPSGLKVTRLRFGEYNTKTRVVFDLSTPTSYQKDLDNNERLFVVELDGAAWGAVPERKFPLGSAIKSYTTQANNSGGTRIIFALAQPSNIVYEKALPPQGERPFRLVFDISK